MLSCRASAATLGSESPDSLDHPAGCREFRDGFRGAAARGVFVAEPGQSLLPVTEPDRVVLAAADHDVVLIIPVIGVLYRDLVFRTTLGGTKASGAKDSCHFLDIGVLTSDAVTVKKVGTGSPNVGLGQLDLGLEARGLGLAGRSIGHRGERAGSGRRSGGPDR